MHLSFVLVLVLLSAPTRAQDLPAFDGQAALELIEAQVAFGPRVPGSKAHAAQLAWMQKELAPLADKVTPHAFRMPDPYGDGELALTNLTASWRPELRRRVAFAAHWDCRPRADKEKDPTKAAQPIDGANDGGSGVAVLMQLATQLSSLNLSVGVDLIFFDGEDYGREGDPDNYLLGSRRYVVDHPGYRPDLLVLLDMVGGKGMHLPMESYGLQFAPRATQLVYQRAMTMGLASFDPVTGPAVMDDHLPFLRAGIPAVDLIDFGYRWWHTAQDTPDKCSASSLGQVGRLLLGLLLVDFAG